MYDLIIVGGGASGFFAAITAKETDPHLSVLLLENSHQFLSKVLLTGGGRCNLSHACYDPFLLATHYPRGHKELISPFHTFQPKNIMDWFEKRKVPLKIEMDGRVFPSSDKSETIVSSLITEAKKIGVEMRLCQEIKTISRRDSFFTLTLPHTNLESVHLLLCTGSSAAGYTWAKELKHSIQAPIPSLFPLQIASFPLASCSGTSVSATVSLDNSSFSATGPLLFTHFGFSGPAIMTLSSKAARYLYNQNYQSTLCVNFLPDLSSKNVFDQLTLHKSLFSQKILATENPFSFSKNLWKSLLEYIGIDPSKRWSHCSKKDFHILTEKLLKSIFQIEKKAPHKGEFVTCGGITLSEIDWKTMQSKLCKGLFFAGEILDVDGFTGGFNLQSAWTTGYIAGKSAANLLKN
jgi:hypothetical protein